MDRSALAEAICKTYCIHRKIREFLVALVFPGFFRNQDYEIDFFGMRYLGNTGIYLDREVLMRGAYEKFLLFFMRDIMAHVAGRNGVLLDVGANAGHHSLFMSQYASQIHAFEPYALARNKFHQLIALNGIANIVVHEEGLSNNNATLPFIKPDETSLGNGHFSTTGEATAGSDLPMLQVVRGDSLIEEQSISNITIIKIDVEGHEQYVLEGLQQTIIDNQPVLIFEYLESTQQNLPASSAILRYFPPGYKLYYFSQRNKKTGSYTLQELPEELSDSVRDIIAIPPKKFSDFPGI